MEPHDYNDETRCESSAYVGCPFPSDGGAGGPAPAVCGPGQGQRAVDQS